MENLNTVNEVQESVVDSQESISTESEHGEVATPQQEESKLSVNQETDSKPVQSAEENSKFAAMRRELEAKAAEREKKAQDALISRMYGESHGIHTVEDYEKAYAAQQEQQKVQELVQKNIPEEYAREMVENQKFRQQFESQKQQQARQAAEQQDRMQFLEWFKKENQRDFDGSKDTIPSEVWQDNANGLSLVDAYAKHERNLLKQEIAELKKGLKVQEVNSKNAKSSTGSLTGNGKGTDEYISKDNFEVNKGDRNWVIKNLSKITASRSKW